MGLYMKYGRLHAEASSNLFYGSIGAEGVSDALRQSDIDEP